MATPLFSNFERNFLFLTLSNYDKSFWSQKTCFQNHVKEDKHSYEKNSFCSEEKCHRNEKNSFCIQGIIYNFKKINQ